MILLIPIYVEPPVEFSSKMLINQKQSFISLLRTQTILSNPPNNSNTMSLSLWNASPFGGFDDDFFSGSPIFGIPPMLTNFKEDKMLLSSPRYEVTENSKQFRLAVDVPGVKAENIKVGLEHGGRVLHLEGHRKIEKDNSYEEYKFDKRFTLGRDVDTTKVTAHLNDGVLVLTAPKKEKEEPKKVTIAITQGEAPPALMEE